MKTTLRIEQIKREIRKLKRTVDRAPRVWRFRGRRVVHAEDWKWADWSKLPDKYSILIVYGRSVPEDYLRDYAALMEKLEDATYGKAVCWSCVIHRAQDAKKELDRHNRYWQENGGETAKERWYQEAGEPYTSSFRKQDAMRQVEWRIYNELAEANNRICEIHNYFHCPYRDARDQLLQDGDDAHWLWEHIQWYDRHWNRNHTFTPSAREHEWYHYDEPPIIDVTDYDDIMRAIDDDRLDRIIDEHTRYMKETDREIWAL
jgi:hypothetical protein